MKDDEFESWFARNHPWDWFAKYEGEPVSGATRIVVWGLCRAAWKHEDAPRTADPTTTVDAAQEGKT